MDTALNFSKNYNDKKRYITTIIVISVILMTLNFLVSRLFFMSRELVSEFMIINTIYQNYNELTWIGMYFYDGTIYASHLGLHAFIFSIPAIIGLFPNDIYFSLLHLMLSFLFFYINISIFFLLKEKFSTLASFLYLIVILLNPIFLLNANNLYWVYFTLFIPLFVSLKFYGKNKMIVFYFILFLSFLLRASVGFEYYSTVVLSALIPIFFELNDLKVSIKKYISEISKVFFISMLAFLLPFSVLLLGSNNDNVFNVVESYFTGKTDYEILEDIIDRSSILEVRDDMYKDFSINWNQERSSFTMPIEFDKDYEDRTSLFSYVDLNIFTSSDEFRFSLSKTFYVLQFLSIFTLTIIIILCNFKIRDEYSKKYLFVLAISFIASLSWPLLMPLHFFRHWRGVADIVLIFPYYSFTVLIFFDQIQRVFSNINLKYKRSNH